MGIEEQKLNIFYLDDEVDMLEIFVEIFGAPHVNIKTFQKSDAFLRCLEKENPDLVFIDFRMPSKNGDLIACEIKWKGPIYMLTGEVLHNFKFPFTGILEKPLDIDLVHGIIKRLQATKISEKK